MDLNTINTPDAFPSEPSLSPVHSQLSTQTMPRMQISPMNSPSPQPQPPIQILQLPQTNDCCDSCCQRVDVCFKHGNNIVHNVQQNCVNCVNYYCFQCVPCNRCGCCDCECCEWYEYYECCECCKCCVNSYYRQQYIEDNCCCICRCCVGCSKTCYETCDQFCKNNCAGCYNCDCFNTCCGLFSNATTTTVEKN